MGLGKLWAWMLNAASAPHPRNELANQIPQYSVDIIKGEVCKAYNLGLENGSFRRSGSLHSVPQTQISPNKQTAWDVRLHVIARQGNGLQRLH